VPGGPSDDALAGRWLSALEALVARGAHEVNNALNGAVMNLEVVRLRARPGADPAGAAPFAASAAEELERANTLVAAVLALARAPRGDAPPDVGEALRQASALVAPVLAHRRVGLDLDLGGERAPTAAPVRAVRLALVRALLGAGDILADQTVGHVVAAEFGNADDADESVRLLRCTLRSTPAPVLRLHTPVAAAWDAPPLDAADADALQGAGVELRRDGDAWLVHFPAP
jgi:hypothetical protein